MCVGLFALSIFLTVHRIGPGCASTDLSSAAESALRIHRQISAKDTGCFIIVDAIVRLYYVRVLRRGLENISYWMCIAFIHHLPYAVGCFFSLNQKLMPIKLP